MGRSKEWHLMEETDVAANASSGCIVCDDHKAAKWYGSIAKFVPRGLAKAFAVHSGRE